MSDPPKTQWTYTYITYVLHSTYTAGLITACPVGDTLIVYISNACRAYFTSLMYTNVSFGKNCFAGTVVASIDQSNISLLPNVEN
jgi:hypothetical protein